MESSQKVGRDCRTSGDSKVCRCADSHGAIKKIALDIACDLTLEYGIFVSVFVADDTFLKEHEGFSFLEAVQAEGVAV